MHIWMNLILVLQILSALAMIGLVLIQHGKGADMGASFGGGSSGSLFGATGSANFLSRSTAACATLFFICTLTLAFMSNSVRGPAQEASSVLDRAAPAPAAASAPAAGVIPGTQPLVPATPASGAAGGN
ncbi:preprotein translocase subunit SecG [Rubrivivax gelatinosus]|uniref:Protein-export membrane protein SecG n=1 Tax=Rubrivivax gelatinosus TaxID=28068 RepID=A0ABS1DRY5_RUBGE|nr:preprotein translocase subunit SecG [Rubrivivax gelatinosus]MBK1614222.1 preprotein translocase subunit SecG [Rubrivivax gelatinosus]MBK1712762.1 preprotein translocase subunit SecG [Rubrivivax gelatinosus]